MGLPGFTLDWQKLLIPPIVKEFKNQLFRSHARPNKIKCQVHFWQFTFIMPSSQMYKQIIIWMLVIFHMLMWSHKKYMLKRSRWWQMGKVEWGGFGNLGKCTSVIVLKKLLDCQVGANKTRTRDETLIVEKMFFCSIHLYMKNNET